MSGGAPIHEVIAVLGRRSEDRGFAGRLRALIGDYESWADEGDIFHKGATSGVEVLIDTTGVVRAVFLFGPGCEEGPEYRGELPFELSFSDSRQRVRSLLGAPDESGEGEVYLGKVVSPWDKYRRPGYSVHLRYSPNQERIDRVTLQDDVRSQDRGESGA